MRLIKAIEEKIRRENGVWYIDDVEIHSEKAKVDVCIFWHTLCFNVGYYPIVQIYDKDDKMILNKEGSEFSGNWLLWIGEMLEDYLDIDDWTYI